MTKIEELETISRFLMQEVVEIPSFVTLGTNAYRDMLREMSINMRYSAGSSVPSGLSGIGSVYLSAGQFNVYMDPNVHVDRVSIGTITIGDVLPSLKFFKTLDRLGLPTPVPVAHL